MEKALTAKEAAEKLRCSYWRIIQMVHRGEIPSYRVGKYIRIREEALDEWIRAQELFYYNPKLLPNNKGITRK
ncbi:helix-turn-helix domain-containing protein [Dehalobacter sp.]|uniref:helix-turn-helix domain-containing protein n=1 Tax=Dehalobacter sp. TaxID=1962289 RepID=UPI00258836C7|nr:helix-turn-helix domain-containing protein [Dehalobacter sp.]MDJ0305111.1 helix-turn-helix domain-containing protein [Dehalobacter sp.]